MPATRADWLELIDGSKIRGQLVSQQNGFITFKGKYVGEIKVSEKDGSVITEKVETADNAGTDAGTVSAKEKEAEDTYYFQKEIREAKEYFVSMLPTGWEGKLDFGLFFISTSTNSKGLNLGLKAKKEVAPNHYSLSAFYNYLVQSQTEGPDDKQLDKWGGQFNYKHDIPQIKWLFFEYRTSYLRDMVKNIKNQVQNNFGVGFRIFNDENFKFTLTPAATVEYLDAPGVHTKWIGYTTLFDTIEYHFTDSIRLEQNGEFSIAPYDLNYYQYMFSMSLITKLTDWIEVNLNYQRNYTALSGTDGAKSEEIISVSLGVPF